MRAADHTPSLGLLLGLALWLAGASPAWAHDTWVQPLQLRPVLHQPLQLQLSAGHGLQALVAPKQRRQRSLRLSTVSGLVRRAWGWRRQRARAITHIGPLEPGLVCVQLACAARLIEIAPEGVERYLDEVQPSAELRALWSAQRARGEPWRERYAKEAKAYVRAAGSVGAASTWRPLRALGQRLELLPLRDPTRLRPRAELPLELRLDGRPLAAVALRCYDRKGERVLRTDAQGRVRLPVRSRGRQLVATTVLQAPLAPGLPWRSRFATLAFQLP
jgi:hypothetical protein